MTSQERRSCPSRPRVVRRQTVPNFPATPPDDDRPQQQQKNRDSWKKHLRRLVTSSPSAADESNESEPVTGARGRRLLARLSGDEQSTAHVSHVTTSVSGFSDARRSHRRLGRTPSSPSVLLSKVRERIREKVSQLSLSVCINVIA